MLIKKPLSVNLVFFRRPLLMLFSFLACISFSKGQKVSPASFRDTVVLEGFIGSDKTLAPNKVYVIRYNVKVGDGATLTVPKGSQILFDYNTSLVVEGGLDLAGEPNDFIQLSSIDEKNQGVGILIRGSKGAPINIKYCDFSKLTVPIKFDLEWFRHNVNIEHNVFHELYTGESNILITSPFVSYNRNAPERVNLVFSNNSFHNNWGSIFIENFQDNALDLDFSNNLITNNVVYGIDIGIPSNTPVFGLFDDVESQYTAKISGNSIFGNYQINSSTDSIIREISFGIQGDGEIFNVPNNFFRSTDPNYIYSTFDHFYQNSELPLLRAEPFLREPLEVTPAHIWKVSIDGKEITDYGKLPDASRRDASFEVHFNKAVSAFGAPQLKSITYDTLNNEMVVNPLTLSDMKWSADKKMLTFTLPNASFMENKLGYLVFTNFMDKEGFQVPDFSIGQSSAINNYKRMLSPQLRSADLISGMSSGKGTYVGEGGYLPDERSVDALKALTDFGDISALGPYRSLAKTWEAGAVLGASNYFGTLTYKLIERNETNFAFGVFGQYNAHKWFSIRAMLWYGRISGSDFNSNDPEKSIRGLNFRNDIIEGSLTFHWHLLRYGTSRGEKFSPSIFAGIALFRNNPMARIYLYRDQNGDPVYLTYGHGAFQYDGSGTDVWVPLRPIGTEGQTVGQIDPEATSDSPFKDLFTGREPPKQYKKVQVAFPIGIAMNFILYNSWSIGAELGVRLTTTRYLDDVGGYYYDRGSEYSINGSGTHSLHVDSNGLPVGYHQSIVNANTSITGKVKGEGKVTLPNAIPIEYTDGDGNPYTVNFNTAALLANPSLVNVPKAQSLSNGNDYAFSFPDARRGKKSLDHYVFVGVKVSKIIKWKKQNSKSKTAIAKNRQKKARAKVRDSDKDGLSDVYEKEHGLDHRNPDTDGDGLTDGREVNETNTDPLNPDTDSDGLNDGREVNTVGSDPNDQDTDDDGLTDYKEVEEIHSNPLDKDTDKGGVDDGQEVMVDKTNPLNITDDKVIVPVKDRDGDGIEDDRDNCPDVRGIARFRGCPDTDGDGIEDAKDDCPNEAGVASNNGCPEKEEKTLQEDLQKLFRNIEFDTNKDVIRSVSFDDLDKAAEILKDNPQYNAVIEGHTDNVGNDVYNKTLSQQRADAVKRYLENKGVGTNRITAIGYGEERPKDSNLTEAGRQANRRVEVRLIKIK